MTRRDVINAGHRNEAAWNNWVYRKDLFLHVPNGIKE